MTGKVAPETLKPVPLAVAELTVKATVPLEVNVTAWVEAVFRFTFPKERLLVLNAIEGTAAFSCMAKFADALPALAVSVAVCAVLTAATVAEKAALAAPAATVTVAGTVTAELLEARLTANPAAGAAPFNDTVQLAAPAPTMDALPHARELSASAGNT